MKSILFMHVFQVEQRGSVWIPDLIGREAIRACVNWIKNKNTEVIWLFGGGHNYKQNGLSWSSIYRSYLLSKYPELIDSPKLEIVDEQSFRGTNKRLAIDTRSEIKFLQDYLGSNKNQFDSINVITASPHISRIKIIYKNLGLNVHIFSAEDILGDSSQIHKSPSYLIFQKSEKWKVWITKWFDPKGNILEFIARIMDKIKVFKKF